MKRGLVLLGAVALGIGLLLAPAVTRNVLTVLGIASLLTGAILATVFYRDDRWAHRGDLLLKMGCLMGIGAVASGLLALAG